MSYQPSPPPSKDKPGDLQAWAWRELQRIAAVLRDNSAAVEYSTGQLNISAGNNIKPDGAASANTWLVSTSSSQNLTGIALVDPYRLVRIVNKGTGTLVLTDQDAASSASSRIDAPGNVTLQAGGAVEIWRDPVAARWRVLYPGSTAGGGGQEGSHASLSAAIAGLSPSCYWQCTEASATLVDSSGNGYHLGNFSGSFTYQFSALLPRDDTAFLRVHLATPSRVSRANPFSVPLSGDYSVFAVCMPLDISTEGAAVFSIHGDGETEAANYQVHAQVLNTGVDVFWEYGAGTNADFASGMPVLEGVPICYGLVKDGTANTIKLYLDGRLVYQATYANEPTGGGSAILCIGDNGQADMVIGHVAFWSGTKLSAAQMKDLATQAGLG